MSSQTDNSQIGKKIVSISREIRVMCTNLIEISHNAQGYSAQQKQDTLRSNIERKLEELKNVAQDWSKIEEEYERKKEEERRRKEEEEKKKQGDSLLVKAAKEESFHANVVAREAEKYAQLINDPKLKQQILSGAQRLKVLGDNLVFFPFKD